MWRNHSFKRKLTPAEVKRRTRASLESVPIGKFEDEMQGGKDLYIYIFEQHPDLRRFFKGAESFTAEDVQKSERFAKQGQRIMLSIYVLANTFDDEKTFRAFTRETINKHRPFKMDPGIWAIFFTVFVNFLETRGKVTDEQKAAWKQLGKVFNEECQNHLKDLGLPHV